MFWIVSAKFIKGINYFKNLRQKNRQVAMNTINFILNKQFHELAKFVVNTPNEPWPTTPSILKKVSLHVLKSKSNHHPHSSLSN